MSAHVLLTRGSVRHPWGPLRLDGACQAGQSALWGVSQRGEAAGVGRAGDLDPAPNLAQVWGPPSAAPPVQPLGTDGGGWFSRWIGDPPTVFEGQG